MKKIYAVAGIAALLTLILFVSGGATEGHMFTGNEDHKITMEEAINYTENYRATITPGEKLGGFFGREVIEEILAQEEAVGIRYYYGMDSDGKQVLVLVGADAGGNDLLDGTIAEKSYPCPPFCVNSSPLAQSTTDL